MNIDFSEFDEKDESGKYIYSPPYTLSVRKKAVYLKGWTGDDVANVDEQLIIYKELPIVCRGSDCQFSSTCPLIRYGLVSRWVDQSCPIETIDAFRHFAGYVNDLGINPTDYTDIQMVNDLVRLQIQMYRCDKLIRKESPVETMVVGTDTKTGLKHDSRQPNQLIAVQRGFRQDIDRSYTRLLASRQAKSEAESKQKQRSDASNQMAEILSYSKSIPESSTGGRMNKLEIKDETVS